MKDFRFNGAWEERGVIGTRIEIDAPKITILWRNSPVLETKFTLKKRGDDTELVLKKRGLRYERDIREYAEVKELVFHDGKLIFTKDFPITGESAEAIERTEQSRYGNYAIADELLPELQGEWSDEEGFHKLSFLKDTMTINGRKIKIRLLRPNGQDGFIKIADYDPSVYEIFGFSELIYRDGRIFGNMIILDAAPYTVEFRKK